MKRILLTTIAAGCSFAAFGQGVVAFENFNLSSAGITLNQAYPTGTQAPLGNPGFTVALLWDNGGVYQVVSTFQSSTANVGAGNPGYFNAGSVTIPTFTSTGTFEVEGWYNTAGNYSSYAAAVAAGSGLSYVGITSSFTATEVQNPTPSDPIDGTGQWSGDLTLTIVPEPSTIALGGLGAAALLLFRRKK